MFNRNKQKSLVHFCVKKDILKVSSDVQRDIDIIEILNSARLVMGTEEELRKQGKPEAIWDKILPGQIERYIADNTQLDQRLTLLGQFYVMDDKKTIEQVIAEEAKKLGGEIEIVSYVRFEVGEGLEKKTEDFAAEVAAQMA